MNPSPNIVLIFTDQHLKTFLGCYGSQVCRTPNLDRLAARGTVFDNAYTTSPICSPARASVQTGLYPFKHGMQTNIFMHGCMLHELPDSPALLSRRLAAAGYTPYYTGKWHLGYGADARRDPYYQSHYAEIDSHLHDVELPDGYCSVTSLPTTLGYVGDDFPGHGGGGHAYPQYGEHLAAHGLRQDVRALEGIEQFEVTSPIETTVDHFLTDRACHWFDEGQRGNKPFFLMLNYWGPHRPYYVPTRFVDEYRDAVFEPWSSFDEDTTGKPRIHDAMRCKQETWASTQAELRLYAGYVAYIDWEIGRFLDHLDASGEADHTVVLFASDHGDSLGIHNRLFNKSIHLYEPTTSIGLIVADPRVPGGRRESRFANLTDLYSTILDLAGVAPELQRRHGRSLMPLVQGEGVADWPTCVVTEGSGLQHLLFTQRAIRCGDIKYVFNCGDRDELYDLARDPDEMRNLSEDPAHAGLLRRMQEALATWMRDKGDGLLDRYVLLRDLPLP